MKQMKKALSILLAVCLMAGLLVIPASAADGPTISVTSGTLTGKDGTVTLDVNMADNPGITSLTIYVFYKTDTLSCGTDDAVASADGWAGANANGNDTQNLDAYYAERKADGWSMASFAFMALNPVTANGKVGSITFKLVDGVENCETPIEVEAEVSEAITATGGKVTVTGIDPTIGTLELASTADITVDGTNGGNVKATVKSTKNADISSFVTWSVSPADQGVTVGNDGTVTVDKKAKDGTYAVKAEAKAGASLGEAKTVNVVVKRATPVVTSVEMAADNATTALIPPKAEDPDNTYTYAATVLDQYGDKMDSETVAWSVDAGETGVTINETTGVLTVSATAKSGDVTITATSGSATKSMTVKVTNISFTGVDAGITAKDGVYGDKLNDLVKIDDSKLTATAGEKVVGKYSVVDGETMPAAADAVAYQVVFNSDDEVYKNITVKEGTVKVAKKVIEVKANDIDVKVGAEQADIDEQKGYTKTDLVGTDELSGTAAYKFYAKNEDGTKGAEVTTISTEEPAEFIIEVSGLTASANYEVKFVEGTLTVSKKSSLRPPIGQGTNPDGTEKDPEKPSTTTKVVFDDVKEGDWFYDAVNYVAENNLMNGTAEKIFEPATTTNRAMIATILWRQAGSPKPLAKIADFPDVVDGSWYADAVRWCAEKEIVNGFEDGTFGPDKEITREQLAAMLYRYAGSPEVEAEMGMAGFEDVDTISEWAATAMRWAVQNGILNGKDGVRLDPQGLATRAETAAMFQRYLSKK